jgi:thiol-disulfide isomerase/thioredoxin
MQADNHTEHNTHSTPAGFHASRWLMAATAIAATFSGLALWREYASEAPRGGLPPGFRAPEIRAGAWLNVEQPDDVDFTNQVVLVQGWFTNCPQCHEETPKLVELYKEFHKRGVQFVSLTFEDESRLDAIRTFVREKGVVWPVGYRAQETLELLEAERYPCLWLVDRSGNIVWNHDSPQTLRDALESVLDDSGLGDAGLDDSGLDDSVAS